MSRLTEPRVTKPPVVSAATGGFAVSRWHVPLPCAQRWAAAAQSFRRGPGLPHGGTAGPLSGGTARAAVHGVAAPTTPFGRAQLTLRSDADDQGPATVDIRASVSNSSRSRG